MREWVRSLLDARDPSWVTRMSIRMSSREIYHLLSDTGLLVGYKRITWLCSRWGLEYGHLRRSPKAMGTLRHLLCRVALVQMRDAVNSGCDVYYTGAWDVARACAGFTP